MSCLSVVGKFCIYSLQSGKHTELDPLDGLNVCCTPKLFWISDAYVMQQRHEHPASYTVCPRCAQCITCIRHGSPTDADLACMQTIVQDNFW